MKKNDRKKIIDKKDENEFIKKIVLPRIDCSWRDKSFKLFNQT